MHPGICSSTKPCTPVSAPIVPPTLTSASAKSSLPISAPAPHLYSCTPSLLLHPSLYSCNTLHPDFCTHPVSGFSNPTHTGGPHQAVRTRSCSHVASQAFIPLSHGHRSSVCPRGAHRNQHGIHNSHAVEHERPRQSPTLTHLCQGSQAWRPCGP